MSAVVLGAANFALAVLSVALLLCLFRFVRGPSAADRIVALDTLYVDAIALPGHRATKNFFEEHHFTARALTMHHRLEARA